MRVALRSLLPQDLHRVDRDRPPCGNQAGEQAGQTLQPWEELPVEGRPLLSVFGRAEWVKGSLLERVP